MSYVICEENVCCVNKQTWCLVLTNICIRLHLKYIFACGIRLPFRCRKIVQIDLN
jgi:hypothetical protein